MTSKKDRKAAEAGPDEGKVIYDEIAWMAYLYWKADGCPEGRAVEHWLRAEADILACRRMPAQAEGEESSSGIN